MGTFCQKGPHAVLQSLHVHLLCCLCVVDLNFIHLQRHNVSRQITHKQNQERPREASCLPGEVQVPGRPPRRWRRPRGLVKVAGCYRLKAACRLTRESLPRHHRCLRPEEENGHRGDGNAVSSSHRGVQQLGLDILSPNSICLLIAASGRTGRPQQPFSGVSLNGQGPDLDSGAEVSRVVSVVVVIVSNTFTKLSRQPLLALLTQLEEKTMTNLTQTKV